MTIYKLFVPKQAVGADLVYFDLFHASGSGCDISLVSVVPVVSGAVAVTGTVGVDLLLTRTTAIGTGGTAATFEGSSTTAATFSCHNGDQPLVTSLGLSARLTPTGGATAGAVLAWTTVFTEETTMSYAAFEMLKRGMDLPDVPIKPGTGIRVVQGAVASVGNIGFDIAVRVARR